MLSRELGVAPASTPAVEEDESEMTEAETPRLKSADLLAQVMALSPEERIALFSKLPSFRGASAASEPGIQSNMD
jgi:hypothetical protein